MKIGVKWFGDRGLKIILKICDPLAELASQGLDK